MIEEELVELAVQVNGKVRDRITAAHGTDEAILREQALASPRVQEFLAGRAPKKIVVVPDRLISIVG
jgi:leucyl-tRNA synthetase